MNPSFCLAAAIVDKIDGILFMDAPVAGTKPQAANGHKQEFPFGYTA
ncbi:MAG: hypothetical protein P8X42_18410 [Calditrichaceae bacterium]